jgi:hypothetical protein
MDGIFLKCDIPEGLRKTNELFMNWALSPEGKRILNHEGETEMNKEENYIYYGDAEGSIYSDEGQKRLWEEESIIFVSGVHAFKIIPRGQYSPLIELYHEDDGALFNNSNVKFDASWLKDLRDLIDTTLEKLKEGVE